MSTQPDAYRALMQGVSSRLASLKVHTPEVLKAFNDLSRSASAEGALDRKTKEFIALALGIAAHCEPCIAFHVHALVKLGASRQELAEVLGMCTYMGGGPSLMYAASAVAAFDELAAVAAPSGTPDAP